MKEQSNLESEMPRHESHTLTAYIKVPSQNVKLIESEDFRPVSLSDAEWIRPIVMAENTNNSDFSFTSIYAWADVFNVKIANINGCPIINMSIDGFDGYSYPIGAADDETVRTVIEKIMTQSEKKGENFRLQSIPREKLILIERLFPGAFDLLPDSKYFDYIYSADKLSSLSGKKLHSKRNYVNRFEAEFNWTFEEVDESNIPDCMMMDGLWLFNKLDGFDTISNEVSAIKRTLVNYPKLGLDGGLLRIDGKICAFTIGERLSRETYVVHFEKALPDITGAYPMINREFVKYIRAKYPEIIYINREDDMGLENLRKAKRSYYPEFMVEKFVAIPKKRLNTVAIK